MLAHAEAARIREAALILWNFHNRGDAPELADAVVGLGSYDLRVADRCAYLFETGHAPTLLFTGAAGNWTKGLYDGSEARAFADRAVALGVPPDAIILEEYATNIGENLRFAADLLPDARSVLLVTKPQTQLRCRQTALAQWPGMTCHVTAPRTSYSSQPIGPVTERVLICEMVGDLHRLRTYPAKGFQAPVEVPVQVDAAGRFLVDHGYDDHVPI